MMRGFIKRNHTLDAGIKDEVIASMLTKELTIFDMIINSIIIVFFLAPVIIHKSVLILLFLFVLLISLFMYYLTFRIIFKEESAELKKTRDF